MKLVAPFKEGEIIPQKYTADGENVNPEIKVTELPEHSKSLILVVEDPDAKRVVGFTWIHWVVFDIPLKSNKVLIKENSLPGIFGESTYKKKNYGGPNPPKGSGVHHYHFKFYALDCFVKLPEGASLAEIFSAMNGHVLEELVLVGLYNR